VYLFDELAYGLYRKAVGVMEDHVEGKTDKRQQYRDIYYLFFDTRFFSTHRNTSSSFDNDIIKAIQYKHCASCRQTAMSHYHDADIIRFV
jgi:hypothetical protein